MWRVRNGLLVGWLGCAVVALGSPAVLAEAPQAETTVQGEVVDPATYLKEGLRGPVAAEQTYEAVDGGQTLAILEDGTGNLYLLLGEHPGDDPSGVVYDHINERVIVVGTIYEAGGLKGIVVTSVLPVEDTDPTASAPVPPEEN